MDMERGLEAGELEELENVSGGVGIGVGGGELEGRLAYRPGEAGRCDRDERQGCLPGVRGEASCGPFGSPMGRGSWSRSSALASGCMVSDWGPSPSPLCPQTVWAGVIVGLDPCARRSLP